MGGKDRQRIGGRSPTLLPDFCNAVDSLSASLPWIGRSGMASDTPAAAAEAAAGVVSPGGASPPAGRSEEGATMRLLGYRQAVSAVAVLNQNVRHQTLDLYSRYQQPNLEWGKAGASLEQEGRVHLGDTCAFVFAAEGGGMEVFVGRLRQLVTTTTGSGAKGAKQVYATSVMVDDPTATFFAHPYLLVQRDGEHVRLVHRGAELHETFHFTASDPHSDSDGGQGENIGGARPIGGLARRARQVLVGTHFLGVWPIDLCSDSPIVGHSATQQLLSLLEQHASLPRVAPRQQPRARAVRRTPKAALQAAPPLPTSVTRSGRSSTRARDYNFAYGGI